MKNKRGALLIILGIFMISFISAECDVVLRNNCPDNNKVLGLTYISNAHACNLSQSASCDYVLCCDGFNQTRSCSNGGILKLYSTTNAHAQEFSRTTYPVNVCYGNLNCSFFSGECGNPGVSEFPIHLLAISGETNAHIGDRSYSGTGGGGVSWGYLCCGYNMRSYWADHSRGEITQAIVGNTVYLTTHGLGLSDGSQVNLTIWQDVSGASIKILDILNVPVNSSGEIFRYWNINQSIFNTLFGLVQKENIYFTIEQKPGLKSSYLTIIPFSSSDTEGFKQFTSQLSCEACGSSCSTAINEVNLYLEITNFYGEMRCGDISGDENYWYELVCECIWVFGSCIPNHYLKEHRLNLDPFRDPREVGTCRITGTTLTDCNEDGYFRRENFDCPKGCREGACLDKKLNSGEYCEYDLECKSNSCVNTVCASSNIFDRIGDLVGRIFDRNQ